MVEYWQSRHIFFFVHFVALYYHIKLNFNQLKVERYAQNVHKKNWAMILYGKKVSTNEYAHLLKIRRIYIYFEY